MILDQDFRTPGVGDATVFTDMVLELFRSMPGARVVAYDMAMHSADIVRIHRAGRYEVMKTQETNKGEKVVMVLGEHNFRKPRSVQTELVVTAVGGAPVVHFPTAHGREPVELTRAQTKQRENAKQDCTIGGLWRIPDLPVVPKHLRGAQTWIRHTSTDDEIKRGKRAPEPCA